MKPLLALIFLPACASLLSSLPPQTSVCVSVSAYGVQAEVCGTNNEPVDELKQRAEEQLSRKLKARGYR